MAEPMCKGDLTLGSGCRQCSRCVARAFELADRWIADPEPWPAQPSQNIGQSTSALLELARRLTPNPALTPHGTLAVILDGIDRLDDEQLARALGYIVARNPDNFDGSGKAMDVEPMTDEQWLTANPQSKHQLILTAKAVKLALRHIQQ